MEKIILRHQRAPGDILVMTAVARDLALTYPGRFHIAVDTTFRELWDNNPYIQRMPDKRNAKIVNLTYGSYIKVAGTEKIHFITSFHKNLKTQTGIDVPLLYPHPDLHLSEAEQEPLVSGRYWVVVAGGKMDFTTKHWVYERYQKVVDILKDFGIHTVQIGGKGSRPAHHHPKLKNVIDLIGKTSLRQMIRVINNSDGVICTITSAMHMAAALGKPCVVTGGGREEWWWEGYHRDNPGLQPVHNLLKVDHRYLHTIGKLDCCARKGCWKNKVQKEEGDRSFCAYPVQAEGNQIVPVCMDMITTDKVVGSVLSYYMDGTLPLLEGMVLPDITKPLCFTKDGTKYSLFVVSEGPVPPISTKILNMPEENKDFQLKAKTMSNNLIVNENDEQKPQINEKAFENTLSPVTTTFVSPEPGNSLVDSASIGGQMTLCVLLYGNYAEMHKRCLSSIKSTTTPEKLQLRVYCNAVCHETRAFCDDLVKEGVITKLYSCETNKFKYPCMREMFHDEKDPITTKWTVWFDDDTMCDVDPLWFDKMCSLVNSGAISDPDFGMLGPIYHFAMQPKHAEWVKKADWYRGKLFRDRRGEATVNGNKIFFCTGSCWVAKTEAIKKANIPDVRLTHNGGDICIGEQMWQNGYKLRPWNGDKKTVCWSSKPRRGASQSIFGI